MHEIYSKLDSLNTLNGVVVGATKNKSFTVDFKPGVTTQLPDDQYDALMEDKGGIFKILHKSGDFIESVEKVTDDLSSLEGNLIKAQKALDDARKAQKENDVVDGVKLAEDVLKGAEDTLKKASDANEKKGASIAVKNAKTALTKAQNAAKKGK